MKTKICTKCEIEKSLSEFYKQKDGYLGVSSQCKLCILEQKHDYYLLNQKQILLSKQTYYKNNNKKIKKNKRKYYLKNKIKILLKQKEKHLQFPWKRILLKINDRCCNLNCKTYQWYGGQGIKCLITVDEIKKLWFRDKAYLMKKPTIDRIDNNGNYTYENCRFIEMDINRIKDRNKPILQYDLNGNFIREWRSQTDASKILNISDSTINQVLKGKRKTAGNFIWKYK